jgi:hypothetical protein
MPICRRMKRGASSAKFALPLRRLACGSAETIRIRLGRRIPAGPVDVIVELRTQLPIQPAQKHNATGPALVVQIDEVRDDDDPIMHGSPPRCGSAMRHALGGETMTSP